MTAPPEMKLVLNPEDIWKCLSDDSLASKTFDSGLNLGIRNLGSFKKVD